MRSLLIFSILIALIGIAFGITCYECDSIQNPNCNQYFDPTGVDQVICDVAEMPEHLKKYERRLPATGCMTKFHEGIEGRKYFVRRSCYYGDLDEPAESCDQPDPYVFFADLLWCDVCEGDLCNTHSGVGRSAVGFWQPLTVLVVITVGVWLSQRRLNI